MKQPGPKFSARIDEMFDLLVVNPSGLTLHQMANAMGVSDRIAYTTMRYLRAELGDTCDANVIAQRRKGQRGLYLLTGDRDEATPWLKTRSRDAESRLETILDVEKSLATAYKGSTTMEAKLSRRTVKGLSRLLEDLADIRADIDA